MQASDTYNAGMQYTIRKVPAPVDKAFKARAKAEGKSLNQLAIEALALRAGVASKIAKPKRDLRFMRMHPDDIKAIERTRESFDRVDEELWR